MGQEDHKEQNTITENTEIIVWILNRTFRGVIWMPGIEENILSTKIRIRIGVVSLKSMTSKEEERLRSCKVLTEIIGCACQLEGRQQRFKPGVGSQH